jgi:hypothetical protein
MESGGDQAGRGRILVVASETTIDHALEDEVLRRVQDRDAEVYILLPAVDTRRKRWLSDRDDEIAQATERLVQFLASVEGSGVAVRGHVGDVDAARALDDAVQSFEPTEILISTSSSEPFGAIDERLLARTRKRLGIPIAHVRGESERGAHSRESPARDGGPRSP